MSLPTKESDRSLANRGISNISSVRKTSGMVIYKIRPNYVVLKEKRSRISNTSEWN
ncbi:hypothetical protein [Cylindrospermopsis raciborskii]|uniref:hypothetical protein n=1 Tax=Cylindrospermopsis raciborskii TaxID=77022 RepID=UPI003DA56A8C